jgi:hypothetical protein
MFSMVYGDLWNYHPNDWIVITTNLGWKQDGSAVMGAGLAKDVDDRYPEVARWYGAKNRWRDTHQPLVDLYHPKKLIMLPTKKLNYAKPFLSWKFDSDVELIEQSLKSMVAEVEKFGAPGIQEVYLSPPGCSNGNLKYGDVSQMLFDVLGPSKVAFVIVRR